MKHRILAAWLIGFAIGSSADTSADDISFVGPVPAPFEVVQVWNVSDLERIFHGISMPRPPQEDAAWVSAVCPDSNGLVDLGRGSAPLGRRQNPWIAEEQQPPPVDCQLEVSASFAGAASLACINGRIVRRGATIAGWRLLEIAGRELLLQGFGNCIRIPVGSISTIRR